jgi:hypothetical protein
LAHTTPNTEHVKQDPCQRSDGTNDGGNDEQDIWLLRQTAGIVTACQEVFGPLFGAKNHSSLVRYRAIVPEHGTSVLRQKATHFP